MPHANPQSELILILEQLSQSHKGDPECREQHEQPIQARLRDGASLPEVDPGGSTDRRSGAVQGVDEGGGGGRAGGKASLI
jgi:hypothetical protein